MHDKRKGSFSRAFLFDLRKTLTGKFNIGVVVAIVLMSALTGFFYGSILTTSTSGNLIQSHSIAYYDNQTAYITVLATNQYGGAVAGIPVSIGYNNTYYNGTSNSQGYFNKSVVENSCLSKTGNASLLSYNYTVGSQNFASTSWRNMAFIQGSGYNSTYSFSLINVWSVSQKTSISNKSLAVMVDNGNDTVDYPLYIYALPINNHGGSTSFSITPGQKISLNGTFYVGKISNQGYQVINTNFGNLSDSGLYAFYFVNSSKNLYDFSYNDLYINTTLKSVTPGFITIISDLFAFMIPLLAIFSSYLYFGKDKTNGTMESILPRPVTRGRLITSRFIANIVTSLIAIGLGILVIDILSSKYTGVLLPGYQILELIWAYFVIAAAFIGLVYLISQLTKSAGVVLGISIVFYIVLVLFWTSIIVALGLFVLGYAFGTMPFARFYVIINSFSPIGYSNLVTTHLEGSIMGIPSSVVGVTFPEIFVIGIIWVVVPFGAAYMLAKNRDWGASN